MKQHKRGSVMMETVLILPWQLLVIFGIIQFSFLWVARLMTDYAAFCSARAALVYHPADYANDLEKTKNVAHLAARQVLAWISFTENKGVGASVPGWGMVPLSGQIDRQIKVEVAEEESALEVPGMVTATVHFSFPLFVPVVSTMIPKILDQNAGIPRAVVISSSCTLPKPWTTEAWPKRVDTLGETP